MESSPPASLPKLIQGGMGIGVSTWKLARAVARLGQLGVVSGTALETLLVRRLQAGDAEGDVRFALRHFPDRKVADRVLERYFREPQRGPRQPYRLVPAYSDQPSRELMELTVLGTFVEVFLAKHGHDGPVGINLLQKIQLPILPGLWGAMLAGVNYVLVGAGIPRSIPEILDQLSRGEDACLPLQVEGARPSEKHAMRFSPREFGANPGTPLARPAFLAIISSATLAETLMRKAPMPPDGFVVEGACAGGHNAPPRGALQLDAKGEPVYGPKDVPDLARIRSLGKPFWLAGAYADPGRLREALDCGAAGVQVGTAFAFCEESGIEPALRREVIRRAREGTVSVFTDPWASPTGFPFKVVELPGTLSDPALQQKRRRVCDIGLLRELYRKEDGALGYRCAAEPVADYVRKGGRLEDTKGRKCICNGLFATAGWGQIRENGEPELPLVTSGTDVCGIGKFLRDGETSYTAEDVVHYILADAALPGATKSG